MVKFEVAKLKSPLSIAQTFYTVGPGYFRPAFPWPSARGGRLPVFWLHFGFTGLQSRVAVWGCMHSHGTIMGGAAGLLLACYGQPLTCYSRAARGPAMARGWACLKTASAGKTRRRWRSTRLPSPPSLPARCRRSTSRGSGAAMLTPRRGRPRPGRSYCPSVTKC